MNHHLSLLFTTLLTVALLSPVRAQKKPGAFTLGTTQEFLNQLKQKPSINGRQANGNKLLEVSVSANQKLALRINVEQSESTNQLTLIGSVVGKQNSSFYIRVKNNDLTGSILLREADQAYEYSADAQGNAQIEAKDLDQVLCVEYPEQRGPAKAQAPNGKNEAVAAAPRALESLPGAPYCMLLDFDGEYVAGTPWNEGRPINAAPAAMSSPKAEATWALVSEDFRPFNVNITTSEAVFNRYPKNRRMRCIITPTNTAAPGAGGVAYFRSFNWDDDTPCWVFQDDEPKSAGEAVSHELGHTVALAHDTAPGQGPDGYYTGQGNWAPIMGVGYYKPISQWNRGEYQNAYNREDDLKIIESYLGYRRDDHANGFDGATNINVRTNQEIDRQTGIIERTGDKDFFRFRCGKGEVSFDIRTVDPYGNLDIQAELYNSSTGQRIGRFNDSGLDVKLSANLDAGEYYVAIDGVGAGNPATTGYSDYGSLGSFTITGTVSGSDDDNNDNDVAVASFYEDCDFRGKNFSLGEGNYDLDALRARGYTNDKLSSLTVESGYEVVLYDDSPFGGRAVLARAGSYACLADYDFNDMVSSIVVRRAGDDTDSPSSQRIEAEDYSAMQGVQVEEGSEGQNVGYIDRGDWMAFKGINFPSSGDYRIEYRVASPWDGGRFTLDINAGAQILGEIKVPKTGNWQTWTTVSQTVRLDAGTYDLGIYAQSDRWNINWIKITAVGSGANARANEVVRSKSSIPLLSLVESSQYEIAVYPNPVVSHLTISAPSKEWEGSQMSIVNAQGKRVWTGAYQPNLDVGRLKRGVYSVIIAEGGQRLVRRFIKE